MKLYYKPELLMYDSIFYYTNLRGGTGRLEAAILYLFIVCVCAHCWSEDNLMESVLSFCYVGFRPQTQVMAFGSNQFLC